MKLGLIAATIIGSGLMVATPSLAQVQFGIGPDGRPNIQVGPNQDDIERQERRERRERYRERQRYGDRDSTGSVRRSRDRNWDRDNCRIVTIEERLSNGDIVTRRRERCD